MKALEPERPSVAKVPGHQSALELLAERGVVVLAKVLGIGASLWAALVFWFFLHWDVGGFLYLHPGASPFGAPATVFLVWPLAGLCCLVSGALVEATGRFLVRLVRRALARNEGAAERCAERLRLADGRQDTRREGTAARPLRSTSRMG